MTEGAMMTGCCSGGTRVTVDVERLVVEGETCDRCASTWDAARQAVEMVAAEASGIGLAVDLREVPLPPERISDSNRVLVNGRLVEEWLDGSAAMTECASCGDLVGESVCCRSYEIDGLASDSLSAADIARAIRAAAGLAAPSESPSGDSPRTSVVLVTSSECG
ncbi:MAG: DUF2703 domain-containing protein [Anaerosomatales bacterium]